MAWVVFSLVHGRWASDGRKQGDGGQWHGGHEGGLWHIRWASDGGTNGTVGQHLANDNGCMDGIDGDGVACCGSGGSLDGRRRLQ